jgi:hypothetical protein
LLSRLLPPASRVAWARGCSERAKRYAGADAYTDAYAYAADAADAYAYTDAAAADAYAYAADAAADAAAYAARAARKAFWNRAAKQLLKLLRAA